MNAPPGAIVLGSASPRRAELLAALGLPFTVRIPAVDETPLPGEPAADYVTRLARTKAGALAAPGVVTLGADTAVVLDDRILGKPESPAHNVALLLALQGRSHRVMTGVAAATVERVAAVCVTAEVRFRRFERAEAEAYVRTGEGADKAGGYGIQGIGGILVQSIKGSYSAVVGLPVLETERLLRDFGLDTWGLRGIA